MLVLLSHPFLWMVIGVCTVYIDFLLALYADKNDYVEQWTLPTPVHIAIYEIFT